MPNLLSTNNWTGEFFVPDSYEKRFPGELSYSPEKGVFLTYRIIHQHTPLDSKVLHGILSTGEKCTLFGSFSTRSAGITMKNGLTTNQGKTSFWCLAIGDFLSEDENFENCDFSLTNLQEFFYPSGTKNAVKYTDKPIYSVSTSFGKLDVGLAASFGSVGGDISSLIYSTDTNASEALNNAFQEVKNKFPESAFMHKEEIFYRIFLQFSSHLTIKSAYQHIESISNLFALLLYNPVYPESIKFKKKTINESPIILDIFPTTIINQSTIELTAQDDFHWLMPISKSTIAFNEIFSNWLRSPLSDSAVVLSIQNQTGYKNSHSTHGEIVLYTTQFESISYLAKEVAIKYEYPLQHHASTKLKDGLKKIFNVGSIEEVAKGIADLRNEIAHVGRPKNWLEKLPLREQMKISQCLELTIIGYHLENIGIPKEIIYKYQDKYLAIN